MTNNDRIMKEILGFSFDEKTGMFFDDKLDPKDQELFTGTNFEEDLEACHLMEDFIEKNGEEWMECYIDYLHETISPPLINQMFYFIHAKPIQKVTAAIKMLDEMKEEK
jgi:hypothetical protein